MPAKAQKTTIPGFCAALIFILTGCLAPRQGQSSFQVTDPVNTGSSRAAIAQSESELPVVYARHIALRPRKILAQPVYPPAALAAGAGTFTSFVVLTISETGRVIDIQPSAARLHFSNRFSGEFLAAIKAAVFTWTFEPARNVYWRRNAGQDDEYLRTETIPSTIEMKFTFEPSGEVRNPK